MQRGVDQELNMLQDAVHMPAVDTDRLLRLLREILLWLNENSTDENCRMVDRFVSTEIMPARIAALPSEIAAIVSDMGGALHDTYSHPEVASNFFSTPAQLLERVQTLIADESG